MKKVEAERRGYSVEEFVIKLQSYTYSVRSDDSFMPRMELVRRKNVKNQM